MSDRDRDDEDLAAVAEDLSQELRELREELESDRRDPPRGPLGIPRPPRPREFARFADEVAIPGLIAILEANVKLLEALQRAIRLADTERRTRERTGEVGAEAADRATEVGQGALERVQDGLEDLRSAIEGNDAATDRAGSDILADIEELESEISERIEDSRGRRRSDRTNGAGGNESETGGPGHEDRKRERGDGPEVDVDAELDSLREQYGDDDEDDEDDES
jgi:hypothetical protein